MRNSKLRKNTENQRGSECWVSCFLPIEMRGKKFPTFKRKISYAGNSLVLIIPEDLSKFLNLKKGSEVEFVPLNQRMFAVKVDQK